MKSSTYYFNIKIKILTNFQICISVPLIISYNYPVIWLFSFFFVVVVPFVNHSCIHSVVIVPFISLNNFICFIVIVWLANLNCICFFSVFNWNKFVTYLIIVWLIISFYLWFLYKIRLYIILVQEMLHFLKNLAVRWNFFHNKLYGYFKTFVRN